MATGYTCKVQSGETTDFADFIWDCARAFGALVTMRDDPSGAPVPKRFEPNTEWHERSLASDRDELAEIEAWTLDEAAEVQRDAQTEAVERHAERRIEAAIVAERYNRMLSAVEAWEPPSPDHTNLKEFMIEQLTSSIKWDCDVSEREPDTRTAAEYKAFRIAECQRRIDYSVKAIAEEIERTESRNEWLRLLRESVPMPTQETQPA